MKKLLSVLLILLICLPSFAPALADTDDMNKTVSAPGFVCIDADDPDHLIYAKNPDKKLSPASTTKIMTCILALENCPDLDEVIETDPSAARLNASHTLMGLKKGESLPVRDLLYGLMLPSGNDAAIALACHIAGDMDSFAAMMNEKAVELGMENTHFVTASGVFKSDHYSTARDMAILTAYAMQNETFREIVRTPSYTVPANDVRKNALHLENTNNLIQPKKSEYYPYAIGCKTGSTVQGGKCLVAAAEKDGVTLIVVLLGLTEGGTKGQRIHKCFKDAAAVCNRVFDRYEPVSSDEVDLSETCGTVIVPVEGYKKSGAETGMLDLETDFSGQSVLLLDEQAAALREGTADLSVSFEYFDETVTAPIAKGDVLGTVRISLGSKQLFESDLVASRDVEAYDPADDPTPSPVPTAAPAVPTAKQDPSLFSALEGHDPTALFVLGILLLLVVILIIAVLLLVKSLRRRH